MLKLLKHYQKFSFVSFLIFICLAAGVPNAFAAVTESTLYTFSGTDGANPFAGLIQGTDGAFYGTTSGGGSHESGTVFKIMPDGSGFVTLYDFSGGTDGATPLASLIQGTDGAFYGTTYTGFNGVLSTGGTVFKLTTDGTNAGTSLTTLYTFNLSSTTDGAFPFAGLIQGTDGALYGTTSGGGSHESSGTVFKIMPDGSGFVTLYDFSGTTDGANPYAGLIQGTDGAFYGTTFGGGSHESGTVFKIMPDGSGFVTLYDFSGTTDGANPYAGLIQGKHGAFYGTTSEGGSNTTINCPTTNNGLTVPGSCGTVFKLTTNGTNAGTSLTTLHDFNGTDGASPTAGLIQSKNGTLYGTTLLGGTITADCATSTSIYGFCGTVFKIKPNGNDFTTLHDFNGTDGASPFAGLIQGKSNIWYGTTLLGGNTTADCLQQTSTGFCGTIFSLK